MGVIYNINIEAISHQEIFITTEGVSTTIGRHEVFRSSGKRLAQDLEPTETLLAFSNSSTSTYDTSTYDVRIDRLAVDKVWLTRPYGILRYTRLHRKDWK